VPRLQAVISWNKTNSGKGEKMPRPPIVQCPKCKKFFYWLKGIERCPCGEPVPPEVAFAPLFDIEQSKKKVVEV
jgi:hypothetical protein